jgi:tetratricopeptide (TPR) repeat protein
LYNPNELATAKQHGERALAAYRELGAGAGEAHALWCLADVLRLGGDEDVRQARRNADAALAIIDGLHYPYNHARAVNYVAQTAFKQGRIAEAVTLWEQALAGARDTGNAALQPLVLMNLGVLQVRLGNRARAVEYYQDSSRQFEALGQQQRAAEIQANAAAIRIENGANPEQGLRDVQNALAVARKFGNRDFEVLAAQLTAAYYRYAGRHRDAERELNRALALSRERDLKDDIASLTIDLARSRIDTGDYEGARVLLSEAVNAPAGAARTHARIRLGQTYVRLGDFDAARRQLAQAETDLRNGADAELDPVLTAAMGELAYESGRPRDAATYFARAAARWTGDLPDAASVEARAYLGLIEALQGRADRGRQAVVASLEQARRMRRLSLETLCRVFLARIDTSRRRFDDALRVLTEVPPDSDSLSVGRELRAQVYYWTAQALDGKGGGPAAETAVRQARASMGALLTSLTPAARARVSARPDIRRIIG